MQQFVKHVRAPANIIMVGFGAIGQGVLPLILRHIEIDPAAITIITADGQGQELAAHYGVNFQIQTITKDNYKNLLAPHLQRHSFLLNLSVDVSSLALIELCQQRAALYLDSCIEPWPGGYTDKNLSPSARSNYALRAQVLALAAQFKSGPTALVCQGANPGMVSHFVKQALLNLQRDIHGLESIPQTQAQWAALAQQLGIKTIHIAERDSQVSQRTKRPDEFVNTWSCHGFVSEGAQPAELGWGSHEKHFPHDGLRHDFGNGGGIILQRPGAATRVRSWAPSAGHFHGWLITHNEALSISDYLSVGQGEQVQYRPSCHYSYHPCNNAVLSLHELNGRNFVMQSQVRIMREEIVEGRDELGVLLCGHAKNAYWYGSNLSIEQARTLAPHNTATTLQVTSAVLAGMVWVMENPRAGIIESEQMDYARALEVQTPYLGEVIGRYTDWTPLQERDSLFVEDLDHDDPWQFKNVRVF